MQKDTRASRVNVTYFKCFISLYIRECMLSWRREHQIYSTYILNRGKLGFSLENIKFEGESSLRTARAACCVNSCLERQ